MFEGIKTISDEHLCHGSTNDYLEGMLAQINEHDQALEERILGIKKLPGYNKVLSDSEKLKDLACALYKCEKKDIAKVEIDNNFSWRETKCADVEFDDGTEKKFYFKKQWEGPLVNEALGMALVNLLYNKYYNFVVDGDNHSNNIIAIDEIPGKVFKHSDVTENSFEIKSSRNYGAALELSCFLGLDDRHSNNVIFSDLGDVVHIDFARVFAMNPGSGESCELGYLSPPATYNVAVENGRKQARKTIQKNFQDKADLVEKIIMTAIEHGATRFIRCVYDTDSPLEKFTTYFKDLNEKVTE